MGKKIILLSILFSLFLNLASALELTKKLDNDLLVYDKSLKSLVPLLGNLADQEVVYLKLQAEDVSNHSLNIHCPKPYSLFYNNKLISSVRAVDTLINIASLIPNLIDDHIYIAIYSTQYLGGLDISLYRESLGANIDLSSKQIQKSNTIVKDEKKDRYLSGLILCIITFLILKTLVPNIFERVFRLKIDVPELLGRSSSKLSYFQNESFFIFLFISILVGIYCYVFVDNIPLVKNISTLNQLRGAYLFFFGMFFTILLFAFKYFIYKIVSYIFGVGSFAKVLINEFSKTVFQALVFVYPVYFVWQSPYHYSQTTVTLKLVYPLIFVLSIFLLKELYYFYKLFNFRKFYIIAYICICDLFPTCIFLKILTQLEYI